MFNNTGVDDCAYPLVTLDPDESWVFLSSWDHMFYCVMADTPGTASLELGTTVEPDAGDTAEVSIIMSRLHCDTSESDVVCPTYEEKTFTVTVE